MICDFCTSAFFQPVASGSSVGDLEGHHHTSETKWTSSAEKGCAICSLLLEDTKLAANCHVPDGQPHAQAGIAWSSLDVEWPLYKGSLRELAGPESFLLSMQQVGHLEPKSVPSDSSEATITWDMPTRQFLVYPARDLSVQVTPMLGESTDGAPSWLQVQRWLQECNDNHTGCRRAEPHITTKEFLPKRLLDVQCPEGSPIRLVHSSDPQLEGPYCTLSHCWGLKPLIRLTTDTFDEFTRGIAWEKLPRTFQEAVTVTRRLRVRYLWIDSLTIIQAGDDKKDWTEQAPLMETVYGNSYCNIAAVNSSDSSQGLFRKRDAGLVPPSTVLASSPILGEKEYHVIRQDFWEGELLEEPLYRRAWVFQERMLSRRLLHFSKRQIFWECPCLAACEKFPGGLPLALDTKPRQGLEWKKTLQHGYFEKTLSRSELLMLPLNAFWRHSVASYTACALTQETDKLVALAGVAKLLRHAFQEGYFAGLWEKDLEEQLAWRVVDCKKANGEPSARQIRYRAPSWSWASVDGMVDLQPRLSQKRTYRAKLTPQITPATADNIAWVSGGSLHVQGHLGQLSFTKEDEESSVWKPQAEIRALQDAFFEAFPDVAPIEEAKVWYCLPLAFTRNPARHETPGHSGHGILLEKVPDRDAHFIRMGSFRFTGLEAAAWKAVERTYITKQDSHLSQAYDSRLGHTITVI